MSFYVCAGLYAEGPSDYRFLVPLIDRVLKELLSAHFTAQYDFAETLPLPDIRAAGRDRRIAAAIAECWTTFTLFIIHSDGDGDPKSAYAHTIAPAIKLARERRDVDRPKDPLAIAACIPERELEAWLLTDPAVFKRQGIKDVELPPHPDRVTDPKKPLAALLKPIGLHRDPPFEDFGQHVSLDALRKLEAFREFEAELLEALHLLARPGGRD